MDVTETWKYWKQINRIIHFKYHETSQKYGLTLEQFHLLIELDEIESGLVPNNGLPPAIGQIAADIGNAPHTLSGRIKRLEKKGLIKKVRDENDLRINRVVFTDEGRDLIKTIKNEASDVFIQNAFKKMDEETLNNFLGALKELKKNLSVEEELTHG